VKNLKYLIGFGQKKFRRKYFINFNFHPQVSEAGGVWTIKTATTLKTVELKFELGKEFEETTPDGNGFIFIVSLINDRCNVSFCSVEKMLNVILQYRNRR
jgi:hypothetical protein